MLSSSGFGILGIRDQDVTVAITPIDGQPQSEVTPSEETASQLGSCSGGSSRATLPIEVEESSLRRTTEVNDDFFL